MKYKTLFLSDIHLGTNGCQAETLLDLLKHVETENIYLVGDIIDVWAMRRSWNWKQSHNDVIQKLLRKARKGTKVTYVPGNHDELFRDFCPTTFGSIEIVEEAEYQTVSGKKFLITHGDKFDGIMQYAKWLAYLGDIAYNLLIKINTYFNHVRHKFGFGYWSLSAYLKNKVKSAASFICDFEINLANECKRRNFDGIVSGHIHHAQMKDIDGVIYCNIGDFVESCTGIVEDYEGNFHILHWILNKEPVIVTSFRV